MVYNRKKAWQLLRVRQWTEITVNVGYYKKNILPMFTKYYFVNVCLCVCVLSTILSIIKYLSTRSLTELNSVSIQNVCPEHVYKQTIPRFRSHTRLIYCWCTKENCVYRKKKDIIFCMFVVLYGLKYVVQIKKTHSIGSKLL